MFPSAAILAAIARRIPGFVLSSPPEPLAGGNLNHVWRLRSGAGTLILKYAPPHVASHPEVPLSPERLDFEARALALFGGGGLFASTATADVRPPRLICHDSALHFVLCEDAGEGPDLAKAITDRLVPPKLGHEIGAFIAQLHVKSLRSPTLATAFNNAAIQRVRLQVQYLAAGNCARAAGVDGRAVSRIEAHGSALGQRLLAPGRCLVMGDLWPPSILTTGDALRLIDWEFVHYGHPLQDLAHFGAHCWIQAHTAATPADTQRFRTLWVEFIAGYRATVGSVLPELLPPSDTPLMNVHAGAEILLRCAGAFVHGYCYDGLAPDHRLIREAIAQSACLLADPPADFFMG